MILGSDQGAVVSEDGAATWSSWYNQPTAQFYHVAADERFPYWVTGAQQDSGAVGTPTRSNHSELSMHDWSPLCAGGESGYTAPDPLHPELLFGGTVTRCNVITGETVNVSPERGLPAPARHTWTLPLVFSLADPHALYFSDQFLFKTLDGGEDWTRISPDLTREDPGVPANLDAATAADAPEGKRRGVIYTISPSPLRVSTVWIGTDDGYIQMTNDEGKTWQNVTPPELTPWSKVVMIQASHFDVNEAYAAVDRHRLEDNDPYIYRTRDGGRTWQKVTAGLPAGIYMQTVKEDPARRGLLFAGTELGVWVSFDDGDHWQSLQLNLPAASARDFAIHGDDLIVATHGRGLWIIDDITCLRQISGEVAGSAAYLFRPADAVSIPAGGEFGTPQPRDEPLAQNPPNGAIIDYYLASAQSGPVTLEILDPAGEMIRRYSSEDRTPPVNPDTLNVPAFWRPTPEPLSSSAGMHRWIWDLRPAPAGERPTRGGAGRTAGPAGTTPGTPGGAGAGVPAGTAQSAPGAAAAGPAGPGAGGGGGGGFGRFSPPVLPGTYSVKLIVGGKTYVQPLVVKMDPQAK